MNKEGAIASFETVEDARKAGYLTRLSSDEAEALASLNRHERREERKRKRGRK